MNALADLKVMIERGDLPALQTYFQEIQTGESETPTEWDFLFQKLYLHACLKHRLPIVEWMRTEVFSALPPIQQIAVRHCLAYGKYLLSRGLKT